MQCQGPTRWGWWGGGARQKGVQWWRGANEGHLVETYSPVPPRWEPSPCLHFPLLICCPCQNHPRPLVSGCPPPTPSLPRCCRAPRWFGARRPAPCRARPPAWGARCPRGCRPRPRWPSSRRRRLRPGSGSAVSRNPRGTRNALAWSGHCHAGTPDLMRKRNIERPMWYYRTRRTVSVMIRVRI